MDARFQSSLLTIEEKPEFFAILNSFSLPVEDLYEDHLLLFKVKRNDIPIGCFGLELFGTSALLRSVALFPEYLNQGLGTHLTRMALEQARSREVAIL